MSRMVSAEVLESIKQGAEKLVDDACVIVKTATTGLLSSRNAEIVRIVLIAADGYVHLDQMVKPGRPIPKKATQIHKITNDDVREKLSFAAIAPEVYRILNGRRLVGFSAAFDHQMIHRTCGFYGAAPPVPLSRHCLQRAWSKWSGLPDDPRGRRRLGTVVDKIGHTWTGEPHDALASAQAAAAILRHFAGEPVDLEAFFPASALLPDAATCAAGEVMAPL